MTDDIRATEAYSGDNIISFPLDGGGMAAHRAWARLQSLARHGRQAEERARGIGMNAWADDLSHLGTKSRDAWCGALSYLICAWETDAWILAPLRDARKREAEAFDYLGVHATDGVRHVELLKGYLKRTFGFEGEFKGFSIPGGASLLARRPLFGFAALLTRAKFAASFCAVLRERAQADGAQNLLSLLRVIERDHRRHVSGMEQLQREEIFRIKGIKKTDAAIVRTVLAVWVLDVARYELSARESLRELGVEAGTMAELAQRARHEASVLLASQDGKARRQST